MKYLILIRYDKNIESIILFYILLITILSYPGIKIIHHKVENHN